MAEGAISLVLAAAGSSARYNRPGAPAAKKEFVPLGGRTVLRAACEPFLAVPGLGAIAVACHPGLLSETRRALDLPSRPSLPVLLVPGGATRQASVLNALEALEARGLGGEYVAIHDGARPFVALENILAILEAARSFPGGGAVGAIPIADALASVEGGLMAQGGIDKSRLRLVQTPQIFRFALALRAHRAARKAGEEFPDDASLFLRFAGPVAVVPGDERNVKITWPRDLDVPGRMG